MGITEESAYSVQTEARRAIPPRCEGGARVLGSFDATKRSELGGDGRQHVVRVRVAEASRYEDFCP